MNLITHGLAGWCAGQYISKKPSDAVLLTIASLAPDLDAVGAIVDLVRGEEMVFFTRFHHKFGHNIFAGFLIMLFVLLLSRSFRISLWAFLIFHFHLICDLAGAKGPDGYQWPIYYFYPLSDKGYTFSGQWEINAWPNLVFTGFLIGWFLYQSARTGFSPIRFISEKADRVFIDTLQKRIGAGERKD
jgi:membrane-bound metal-dependent hydrolase YbcI (DUF457 family)